MLDWVCKHKVSISTLDETLREDNEQLLRLMGPYLN